jgi:hypothetical protein
MVGMAATGSQRERGGNAQDRRVETAAPERPRDAAVDTAPLALQSLLEARGTRDGRPRVAPSDVLSLQTRAGNKAVQSLLVRCPAIPKARRPVVKRRVSVTRTVSRVATPSARAAVSSSKGGATTTTSSGAPETALVEDVEETGFDAAVAGAEGVAVQRKTTIGGAAAAAGAAAAGGAGGGGGGGLPPAPMAPTFKKPPQDSKFKPFLDHAKKAAKQVKKHPTGKAEAAKVAAAAKAPPDDKLAQGKAKQADEMAAAKPGTFNEDAFVSAVLAAVEKASPKNLDEAEKLPSSGKPEAIKSAVASKVAAGKETAASDVQEKAAAPPTTAGAVEKPVTPLEPTKVAEPADLKAATAMPAPAPKEQLDFSRGPAEIAQNMAAEKVTEDQLAKANEPAFTAAVEAKKVGEDHAKKAPAEARKSEAQILKSASKVAGTAETSKVAAVKSAVKKAVGKVGSSKDDAKAKDEAARQKVTTEVNAIYDRTKTDVNQILTGLDEKVDKQFTDGEAAARKNFTDGWKRDLDKYKDERYSGLEGAYNWTRDLFAGLPSDVNRIYEGWKQKYIKEMTAVIRGIGKTVSGELNRAKARVEQGRTELKKYVDGLPKNLQKVGQDAAAEMASQFDDLDASVDDKMTELVESVAKKYEESQKAVIEAAQAENRGLIDKAKDAVNAVIDTIKGLKDMLLNVLRKAADAIDRIIKDPIGFLGRLVDGIKSGVQRFAGNILEHLKKGLLGWLFGALANAGIEIPETFDLKGIVKLVLSVLGITWQNVRSRIVKVIGEKAMGALEGGVDIIKRLVTEGPGALWEMLLEKISDFQEMVIGQIKEFVVEKIVKAGITWLISMLNPAAAFIKACKAIYDIVMFFIERGSQIKELVEAVSDGVVDVAQGNIGGIAAKVEGALAKALPMAIGFLASLLGLGGISDKIKTIIQKVQNPVNKAIDGIVGGIVKVTKPIWGFVKDKAGKAKKWAKDKYEAGKAYVNDKIEKGKAWAKGKVKSAKDAVAGLFKKQQKPLDMNGQAHTLIATPTPAGDGFAISMKSVEEPLSKKIGRAIGKLKQRQSTEDGDAKAKTQKQIDQLMFIGSVASDLQKKAKKAGAKQVGPTGAPPGFEAEMAELATVIAKYGRDNAEKDILGAAAGTQVNLELLAKFGMPVASYLQAQDVADSHGATIDIRATNFEAPQLLEKGLEPKAKEVKSKTVNEIDVLLGVPRKYLGQAAWFFPRKVTDERKKEWGALAEKAEARWRERRQEYIDLKEDMDYALGEGEMLDLQAIQGEGVVKGGVLLEASKGVAFTGDHDVFDVNPDSKEPAVITALKAAPFRAKHGAHMAWTKLPDVLRRKGFNKTEKRIYEGIIQKHNPGGEALLRINPNGPPTTASSRKLEDLPPVPDAPSSRGPAPVIPLAESKAGEGAEGEATSVTVKEPFTAGGESHHVEAEVTPDGVDVTVASTPTKIAKWLQECRDDLKALSPAAPKRGTDLLELCERIARSTERLNEIGKAMKERAAGNDVKTQVDKQMKGLKKDIQKALEARMLLKRTESRTLPDVNVRRLLYCGPGSGWDRVRENIMALDVPDIVERIAAVLNNKKKSDSTNAADLRALKYRGERVVDDDLCTRLANGSLKPVELRKAKYWHVDHVVPLAAHWQAIGHNSDDQTRWAAATNAGNLKVIARSENVGAGSEYKENRFTYSQEVGDSFETKLGNLPKRFRTPVK